MTDDQPYKLELVYIDKGEVPANLAEFVAFWQTQLASLPSHATEPEIEVEMDYDSEYDGYTIQYRRPLTEAEIAQAAMAAKEKADALANIKLIHIYQNQKPA